MFGRLKIRVEYMYECMNTCKFDFLNACMNAQRFDFVFSLLNLFENAKFCYFFKNRVYTKVWSRT